MGAGGASNEHASQGTATSTAGHQPDRRVYEPAFARGYPADPALDELVVAFTRGDFASVGRGCDLLIERSRDPRVVAAARDLRARTRPDQLATVVLLLAAALIAVLWLYASQRSMELDRVRREIPGAAVSTSPPPPR